VVPFHGVPSCRNRLLQRGSPAGSSVLPANLLWRGLLSPWGAASAGRLLLHGVLHGPHCGYLLHRGPPWAVGEFLLWHLDHLLLPLPPPCSQGCFSHSPLTVGQGFSLTHPGSPQALPWQLRGWAVPCGGAVGAGQNQPCLARGSPGHPSQRNPPQPPERSRAPAPGALQLNNALPYSSSD